MDDFQKYLENALNNITFKEIPENEKIPDYNLNENIKTLIISARTEAGMTQKQLSKNTGLSQANISRIESGQALPNLGTLKKIADSLGKKLVISFENFEKEDVDGNLY